MPMPMHEQLNRMYRDQIVKMKNGNYHKIKEVVDWDLIAGTIMVNYTEGNTGWVDVREWKKLYEV